MKKLIVVFGICLMSLTAFSQTVYVVPKGKVYHSTKDCVTLKRSKVINEVDIKDVGSRRACSKC